MFPNWIEHRFRVKRRPVDRRYYEDQGAAYYHQASLHPLAADLNLRDVFVRLALGFCQYRQALNQMRRRFFAAE